MHDGLHAATSKVENSAHGLSCQLKFIHGLGERIEAGSSIFDWREPKSCLGRVFNFKLGCFDS